MIEQIPLFDQLAMVAFLAGGLLLIRWWFSRDAKKRKSSD